MTCDLDAGHADRTSGVLAGVKAKLDLGCLGIVRILHRASYSAPACIYKMK